MERRARDAKGMWCRRQANCRHPLRALIACETRATGVNDGGVDRRDGDRRQRMGSAGKQRQRSHRPAPFRPVRGRYRTLTEGAPGVMIHPTPSRLVSKRLQDSLLIRSCWALWILKCDHCGRSTPGHEKARCPGKTNQSGGLRQLSGRRDLNPRPPDPQWRPLRTVGSENGEFAEEILVVGCHWPRYGTVEDAASLLFRSYSRRVAGCFGFGEDAGFEDPHRSGAVGVVKPIPPEASTHV